MEDEPVDAARPPATPSQDAAAASGLDWADAPPPGGAAESTAAGGPAPASSAAASSTAVGPVAASQAVASQVGPGLAAGGHATITAVADRRAAAGHPGSPGGHASGNGHPSRAGSSRHGRGAARDTSTRVEVSVVMPCLNEEESVGDCVRAARAGLSRLGLPGEVVVVDNGSTDSSAARAAAAGARVVAERRRGYGNAYLTGFAAARGRLIVMGDADSSYDFTAIDALVTPLLRGEADYVLGSRLGGQILPGAMPWLHRYVGNPVLTAILNRLFGVRASDAHSGMRAFTRDAYARMALRSEGMELASEIVVAAARAELRCLEIPITYHPRVGASKLDSVRDGWRHLRFMLLLAPRHLFVLPGLLLLGLGLLGQASLLVAAVTDPARVTGGPGVHGAWEPYGWYGTLLCVLAALVGGQLVLLGAFADAHHGRVGWRMPGQRPPRLVRWPLAPGRGGYLGSTLFATGLLAALVLGVLVVTATTGHDATGMARVTAPWPGWSPRLGAPAALPAAGLALTAAALGLQGMLGTFYLRLVATATGAAAR
ncbi:MULTISPECIES: glycosyltransferase family 2 protein [unclassified Pseudofrankia]|uniref:glycosyltransferase family 2 protein n=1 Tax=unclassified Pseudofrankia TaxID=2994372 RepID=UPI001F51A7E8|nr:MULTISPECIES: glycosyltransferase family 2 protein [unclassified Pseudofrankia]MDT3438014.1 glycosyltransferase family 2 protein [Pseudofrankia sp. BMG5.37]